MDWVRFTVSEQSQSPRAPGQSGDRLATLQLPKPRNPMSWAMGSGHLATCPIQAKRTCTYRRTVPEYCYVGTRMPRFTQVHVLTWLCPTAGTSPISYVPVHSVMPQTGGQRAFRQVHPGPLRFHPPTPKLPERPLIAAYCKMPGPEEGRGADTWSHTVFFTVTKVPFLALAHGHALVPGAGSSSTVRQQHQQQQARTHASKQQSAGSSPHRARAR